MTDIEAPVQDFEEVAAPDVEAEETGFAVADTMDTPDIKLFGKWSTDDVQIPDITLQVCYPTESRDSAAHTNGDWSHVDHVRAVLLLARLARGKRIVSCTLHSLCHACVGLHCRIWQERSVRAPHGRPLRSPPVPQGPG